MGYWSLWVSIAGTVAATLFLKEGTLIVGEASENFSELLSWMLKMLSNPYTISAIFFMIPQIVAYTIALSRLKLSYMFPLSQATQLVLVVVFSLLLFEEKVTWLGWLGIVTICIGLFLISMRRNISDTKL